MTKEQLIDRHAQTLKSWVGTGLAKDECIGLIKNAVDEALLLCGVSNQRELLIAFMDYVQKHQAIYFIDKEELADGFIKIN